MNLIYFSPTQSTKKIVEMIGFGVPYKINKVINLTPFRVTKNRYEISRDEFSVIGAPVYGGRLPSPFVRRLKNIKADNSPAILLVVYGNVGYGDALLELKEISTKAGFSPISAGAFIAEPAFSDDLHPIAKDRPDSLDTRIAIQFGAESFKRHMTKTVTKEENELSLPGKYPYHESKISFLVSPDMNKAKCTKCGICSE
ncbi:MAG: 4Fe-4S ferredoxin, partial [Bacteroidetes bacterium]|nr:4Fe-4S ferredoxin [Bacteroidota bacterium]